MSVNFILAYIAVVITILIGITGLTLLIYGLANKQKKLTISGIILSVIAILIISYCALLGARKFIRFSIDAKKEIHTINISCNRHFMPPMGHPFFIQDSLGDVNDSGKVCFKKEIFICKRPMCCKFMKCDTTMCKRKCRQRQ